MIISPSGELLGGPLLEADGTLIAELDLADVAATRRYMDPTGHYSRPDIFRLQVDTTRREASTTITTEGTTQ